MSIEVTREVIREVSRRLNTEYPCDWNLRPAEEIIAAAWAVMSEKHGLEAAVEEACRDLPEDYEIRIWVESGGAGVECFDADGDKVKWLNTDCLEADFREALQAARIHANDPRRTNEREV